MTDEKPRHARIAADFWDHPRTEWMHPLHRDVFTQALAANALGLLELPMARIAKRCKSTEEQIATAMHQMDDEGVAVWWRDLGIFWVINAPERNCYNKIMWRSVHKIWRAQPKDVRDRIVASWPTIANGAPHDTQHDAEYDTPHDTGVRPPNKGVSVSASGHSLVVKGEREDVECAKVAEGLAWIMPAGRKRLLYRDNRVRELVRAGATANEILDVVRRLAEAVEAGEVEADKWSATYVFSGWYDRLRDAGSVGPRREEL